MRCVLCQHTSLLLLNKPVVTQSDLRRKKKLTAPHQIANKYEQTLNHNNTFNKYTIGKDLTWHGMAWVHGERTMYEKRHHMRQYVCPKLVQILFLNMKC